MGVQLATLLAPTNQTRPMGPELLLRLITIMGPQCSTWQQQQQAEPSSIISILLLFPLIPPLMIVCCLLTCVL